MQERIPVSVRTFPSGEAFLFHYAENRDYDILLLDVEMGKLSGIDLAKQIRTQNDHVQIVFITGYPDFMAEGYEVSALHYLMKPVKPEKLGDVLNRAAALSQKERPYLLVTSEREIIRIFFRHYILCGVTGALYTYLHPGNPIPGAIAGIRQIFYKEDL